MKKITLEKIQKKIVTYQIIVMMSFLFGILGFVYNNWRYEHNEYNTNVRMASFQIIQELAILEQNIYANHYDKNDINGNPRDAWVKVGLIDDLAIFISPETKKAAERLKMIWEIHWKEVREDQNITDTLVYELEEIRSATRKVLFKLY
ncbi:MAG: hypothetical protein GQ531_02880 [Sulfurovum sp.]|nr:hypothetical protein [Sulfurovum sp.]